MEEFKTKHNVDRVPKSVIDNFTDNEIIRLDKYEKNALEMLQEHSFSLHLELLKEKIECPKKDEKALLDDIKSKATFKWGRAIGTSALGSFLYLAIAIIITFLTLWGFDFNLKKAGKAFVKAGLETTEKIEQSF
ncbi:MAG: hypothetical protein GQ564_12075 [Bacteroidales bacterium]|nr:hypothetical protein [Bacteroidales bacterium]